MAGKIFDDEDNLTAVLYGVKELRIEQRPIPQPDYNEVLLQIKRVGLCDSDMHYYTHGSLGKYTIKEPMVIGHQASGVVIKLGKGVKNLNIGDRVAVEPGVPCRRCNFCKTGKYNLCPDIKFCATPPVDGTLARYYVHTADFCHKLPKQMTLEEGALLEPLSVGVNACKKGGVSVGSTVLILGAGSIGLVTLATAKAMGASNVFITDLLEYRLNVAREMGASKVCKINTYESDKKTIANVRLDLNGKIPDVTIDCIGIQQSIQMGMELTKSGGLVVVVGMGTSNNIEVPIFTALSREVDIKGVFRYANNYQEAMSLMASGRIDLYPLITHYYKIEKLAEAFKLAESKVENLIKIMINCDPDL